MPADSFQGKGKKKTIEFKSIFLSNLEVCQQLLLRLKCQPLQSGMKVVFPAKQTR